MTLRRLSIFALAVALLVGLVSCGRDEIRTSRPATERSAASPSAVEEPDAGTLRPWTDAERRYCPLAALAMPMYVQHTSQLQGSVEERAAAVTALRDWTRQLREAAPSEIAEAVELLATVSDGDDELAVETQPAYTSTQLRRAEQQHAAYLRDHCGIDFATE
jgi:hypothetical protein